MLAALLPLAAARGASVAVVVVDGDAALVSVWGDFVPVLFAGRPDAQAELCHYRLDLPRVEAALAAPGERADRRPEGSAPIDVACEAKIR